MQPALVEFIDEAAYLQAERASTVKHEYVAGVVFAMAGASKTHGTLAGNAFFALRAHLRGGACRVWMADMKVRVAAASAYYYPDVVVSCDPRDLAPEAPQDYLEAPQLIVEVMSPATEAIDRREKWLAYRQLESLQEYVLIDQGRRWVEVFRRTPAGWTQAVYTDAEVVALASVGLALPLVELYAESGVGEPAAS